MSHFDFKIPKKYEKSLDIFIGRLGTPYTNQLTQNIWIPKQDGESQEYPYGGENEADSGEGQGRHHESAAG